MQIYFFCILKKIALCYNCRNAAKFGVNTPNVQGSILQKTHAAPCRTTKKAPIPPMVVSGPEGVFLCIHEKTGKAGWKEHLTFGNEKN